MSHYVLACVSCESTFDPGMNIISCTDCRSTLDVSYQDWNSDDPGVQPIGWKHDPMPIPIHDASNLIDLGQGDTPVIELPHTAELVGLDRLMAKLEFMNPTGSFKDRGTAIMMSVANELGIKEIVEDSSGNAGASVSAYAARAGIHSHIFAPATAPEAKIGQIKVYGAETHQVEGTRDETTDAANSFYAANDLVYASHNMSPYFIEGTKSFAYEVMTQFGGNLPDHIVIPVGNGSLYLGAWKGFNELVALGREFRMPRLHVVQSEAVMPIVAAYEGKTWTSDMLGRTVAGGIAVGSPPHLDEILNVLKESDGVALSVGDTEIIEWQKHLAKTEGVFAEPTSAAAFAGLAKLVERGVISRNDSVLVPVTGFGLKDAMPE